MSATTGETTEFATRLTQFLRALANDQSGSYGSVLKQSMRDLQKWLEQVPAVAQRKTLQVAVSIGKGSRAHVPWISFLDNRETTTMREGRSVVFLVVKDRSITYLTLNQGFETLKKQLGREGALSKMNLIAEEARALVGPLLHPDFQQDNAIDLKVKAERPDFYQMGTIAHVALPNYRLPSDAAFLEYLESLLSAYDRLIDPSPGPVVMRYGIDEALDEIFLERSDFERWLAIWTDKKNLILQGAPGVGKSFVARRLAYALIGGKEEAKVQFVQFHQSYSYEDFVQGYRPTSNGGFERKDGIFLEFQQRAVNDPNGKYVFIIDEINRGNLSKILGELMLLIESDKRDRVWATKLSYAWEGDDGFYVPNNLYLLGLMNTADRSLSIVDYALRRRFAFVLMEPAFGTKFKEYLHNSNVSDATIERIVSRMEKLNKAIGEDRTNLGPGFRIGHSFFTPRMRVDDSLAWYQRVVATEIAPLLEEYWFDDPDKAEDWRIQLLAQ